MATMGEQILPDYRLTRLLGEGRIAQVWEAERSDGQPVILKILDCRATPRDLLASEVQMLRSLQELQHPHLLRLEDVQTASRSLILVMERADGNLADLQKTYREATGGNIPPAHALDLLEQAATALDFLADAQLPGGSPPHGLQHCNIKPSNLLLVGDCLKVADFGLSTGRLQSHMSGWMGTYPYAAPELLKGSPVRGTDQFALAVTACQVNMGTRVFRKIDPGLRPAATIPIDFTKVRDFEFPVLARALSPQPASRWPSCQAFIAAFRQALETSPRTPLVRDRAKEVRLERWKTPASANR